MRTPTATPMARLWVSTTTTTVVIIIRLEVLGLRRRSPKERQLNVPIETMIITATRAGMGISFNQGPKPAMRMSRNTPEANVDRRPRPPDFTLITV